MIEQKTTIDHIEIANDGNARIKLALLIVEADTELHRQIHRFEIQPGEDFDNAIAATNAHLAKMNRAAFADIDWLRSVVTAAQTPGKIAAFQHKATLELQASAAKSAQGKIA